MTGPDPVETLITRKLRLGAGKKTLSSHCCANTISIFCDPVFRSVRHWVVFQRPCHADIASNSRREYIVKRNFSRLAPTVELWQNCWRIFWGTKRPATWWEHGRLEQVFCKSHF